MPDAGRSWRRGPSRRASSPESSSSAPAGGRPPSRGRAPCSDCLDPRPDSHPPTDPRGLPALEADATPRPPLAWVRRAACLLLLALTASLPLAGAAQAHAQAQVRSDAAALPGGSTVAHASAADKVGQDPPPAQFPGQPPEQPADPTPAPAPITGLKAIPGDRELYLSWNASQHASSYRIRYHAEGYASIPPFAIDVTGEKHILTGLTNNAEYVVSVSGMNGGNEEGPSMTVRAVPADPDEEPTAPGQITYVSLEPGYRQLTVSWAEAPDNGGSAVIGYKVEYSRENGPWQQWPHSGTATTTTITGLRGSTSHAVRVSAINAIGTGPASAPEYASPEGPAVPEGPSVSTTPDGPNAIDVTWPAVPDATHYQIRHALDGSSLPAWSGYQTGTSRKLSGLAKGRRYDIQVRACLSQDADECGDPAIAEGATVPDAPTSLGTSNATATGITLGWSRPSGQNEAVTQVGYNTNTGASSPNRGLADKTGTSHAFSGMNGGIQHKLFARTRIKHSQTGAMLSASAWQSTTGSTTVPGAPSVTANTNGTSGINLTWPGVAGATRYQVRHVEDGGTQPGWPNTFLTNRNHSITGLSAGRIYDIEVRACGQAATASCGSAGAASEATVPETIAITGTSNIGSTSLTLNWSQITGNQEAGIEVGYNTDTSATSPNAGLDSALISAQSYSFSGLTQETTYRFFARTVVKDGSNILTSTPWQGRNETTTDAPAAPGNLSATPDSSEGGEKIDVSWNAVAGASYYQIRHGVTLPAWGTTFQSGTSYEMTNLTAGRRYLIEVRACETQSATTCGVAAATQGATNPSAPGSLDTSGATVTGMTLTWTNPSSGHNEAEVEVGYSANSSDTAPNAGQAFKANGVATHTFSGLNGGIEHKFFARTVVRNTDTGSVITSSAWQDETGTTTAPSAPSVTANTSTTNGGSQIDVTWPSVTGATTYQIRHVLNGGTQPGWPSTFVTSPQTLGSLSQGRIYGIEVRACGSSATSSCGTAGSASEATVPNAVASVSASNVGATVLTLNWPALSGNDDATIEVGYNTNTNATSPNAGLADKAHDDTSHGFTGLTQETTYRFFARSVVKDGSNVLTETAWKWVNETTTDAPAAPGNLSATPDSSEGGEKIDVSWSAVAGASYYQIRHGLTLPNWGTTFQTTTSYEMSSLTAGRRYLIEVRACEAQDTGTCGAAAATQGATNPSAPGSLDTSGATVTGMTLTWTNPSSGHNESEVEVGYSATSSDTTPNAGQAFKANGVTTHTFSGLNGGIEHNFFACTVVRHSTTNAVLTSSAWQSETGTTTAPSAPSVAANTSTTNGGSEIDVTWGNVTGATRYQIRHIHSGGTQPGWPSTFVTSPQTLGSLSAGRIYDIEVRACGSSATSSCGTAGSASEATVPNAVASVSTSNVGATVLTLNWPEISGNEDATIEVGYNTNTSATTPNAGLADKDHDDTSHGFTGLSPTTTYRFFARSVVKDGSNVLTETAWKWVNGTTIDAPAAPGNLSATPDGTNGATAIDVSWSAVTGASH